MSLAGKETLPAFAGTQVVFLDEGRDGQRAQRHADHFVAVLGQPKHVQALAAQWDEHPTAAGGAKAGQKWLSRWLTSSGWKSVWCSRQRREQS